MQVVSRRENESLIIGEDIVVTVLSVRESQVRLAISSPRSTPSYWEQTLHWSGAEQTSELQLSSIS